MPRVRKKKMLVKKSADCINDSLVPSDSDSDDREFFFVCVYRSKIGWYANRNYCMASIIK